jgi:hypothetical protein
MSTVSDVLAFAVQNADYWTDLLSGEDYPPELTGAETEALEAARAHIETLTVELLHLAAAKLAEKLGKDAIATPKFKAASTAKNRSIHLPPPSGLDGKLYRIEFALDRSEDGLTIQLYASLVVKKGSLDALRKALTEREIEYEIDDYYVYTPGLPIAKGAAIPTVADEAATAVARLLAGFGPSAASNA